MPEDRINLYESETLSLKHRGPDGLNTIRKGNHFFGHTRLAINGSERVGRQPFFSRDGRWAIIYNGEIYNWRELSKLYCSNQYFSCDGEVLPYLYSAHGEFAPSFIEGMYGIVAVNLQTQSIHIATDRFGMKPLYFAFLENEIVVCSELRSIIRITDRRVVDENSLIQLFSQGFMLPDQSGIKGIHRCPPGTNIRISREGVLEFLSDDNKAEKALDLESDISRAEIVKAFMDSIQSHLESSVPVGLLLSEGFDSNAIAFGAAASGFKLPAINLRICGKELEATPKEVTNYFGHELHTVNLKLDEIDLDSFFSSIDRPSIDGLNTFLVSREVKKLGLKVALSGLGGDELLTGYLSTREWKLFNIFLELPHSLRVVFWSLVKSQSFEISKNRLECFKFLNSKSSKMDIAYCLQKVLREINTYNTIIDIFGQKDKFEAPKHLVDENVSHSMREIMFQLNVGHYMGGMLLPDSDVYSMANGVELRMPFLDTKFVSSIASFTKYPFNREIFATSLNSSPLIEILKTPKKSFSLPMNEICKNNAFSMEYSELTTGNSLLNDLIAEDYVNPFVHYNRRRVWQNKWLLVCLSKWMKANDLTLK